MFPKSKLVAFLLPLTFLLSACQSNTNLYGYDFQTAKISFKITGSSEGTSEVLIKGEKKYIHNQITQKKLDGTTTNTDTILIQNGEKLYSLEPASKTGTLMKQPFYSEIQKLSPEERKQKLLDDVIRDNRSPEDQKASPIKPDRTEEVAGQKCDFYSVNNGVLQTCVWQGVPLRSIASLPEYGIQTETVATKIELNTDISDSEFDVPGDYQITELN